MVVSELPKSLHRSAAPENRKAEIVSPAHQTIYYKLDTIQRVNPPCLAGWPYFIGGSIMKISIRFSNSMLYDRLRTLADEYSVAADLIMLLALKRLLDDVELLRELRAGKVKLE